MAMLSKVGKYRFLTEPFHCDFGQRIFLSHLGNHLLNAADFHSNDRGYGMNYLNTIHHTWVLSRFVMEMQQMPVAYDNIDVETWVENVKRSFTSRNFAITAEDGQPLGYGRSIWAMIDTDSRQPVDIMQVRDGLITSYIEEEKPCPIEPFSRFRIPADAPIVAEVETHYSDVDVNGHVNSVKYIEHLLNLWPLDFYRTNHVCRIEIAYVAESHCGDVLLFRKAEMADGDVCVSIAKREPNSTSAVEVCKCRVVFAKD